MPRPSLIVHKCGAVGLSGQLRDDAEQIQLTRRLSALPLPERRWLGGSDVRSGVLDRRLKLFAPRGRQCA